MSKKAELSKEAPIRPSNFYFRFRADLLKKHKGEKNANQIIKEEWDKVTP